MKLHNRKPENKKQQFRINLEATYSLSNDYPSMSQHSSKVNLLQNNAYGVSGNMRETERIEQWNATSSGQTMKNN